MPRNLAGRVECIVHSAIHVHEDGQSLSYQTLKLMLRSNYLTDMLAIHLRTRRKEAYLALLSDEYGEFVHAWDSEHLGHKVVAEVARSHLHHLPCFPQLINRLQHNKKG